MPFFLMNEIKKGPTWLIQLDNAFSMLALLVVLPIQLFCRGKKKRNYYTKLFVNKKINTHISYFSSLAMK